MARRALLREAKEEDFEKNFVQEIVLIAKEMGGWNIDSILEMPIQRYIAVRDALSNMYEKQKQEMELTKTKNTFG